jgi:hypothetical protein
VQVELDQQKYRDHPGRWRDQGNDIDGDRRKKDDYIEFVRKTSGSIGTGVGANKKSGKTTD